MAAPLLAALLIAWGIWFGLGRVTIYEVTPQARLEVQSVAHPVAAPVGGRVVETRLAVGRDVRSGEVLVALDGAAEQFAIREKRAYRDALVGRLAALQEEVRAEQEATAAKHEARVGRERRISRPDRGGRGPSPTGPTSGRAARGPPQEVRRQR